MSKAKKMNEKSSSVNELHLLALFQEAAAKAGLVGPQVEEAAEHFVDAVLSKGVKIEMPKGTHLQLGVAKQS
jgi:hypothetical protein